ncbi:MAG: hypothetical protein ACREIC_18215 [Limisphaerales bacterium]
MAVFPTARNGRAADKRRALSAQVASEGSELFAKYGPTVGWDTLRILLDDRAFVRFPCDIRFDAEPLLPGEFAHAALKGREPRDGYTVFVHPIYERQLQSVPYMVLHQLVLVNHGKEASADDAETFGSRALGLSKSQYYQVLCELSEQLGGDDLL